VNREGYALSKNLPAIYETDKNRNTGIKTLSSGYGSACSPVKNKYRFTRP